MCLIKVYKCMLFNVVSSYGKDKTDRKHHEQGHEPRPQKSPTGIIVGGQILVCFLRARHL